MPETSYANVNKPKSNDSKFYAVCATETTRGIEGYAQEYGFNDDDFMDLLDKKSVMDLGSGSGKFAIECEERKLAGRPAPDRVDSVNIRYADENYNRILIRDDITKAQSIKERMLNLLKSPRNRKTRDQIELSARANFKGLDWHDLSELSDNTYDVIISSRGFPYYSDLVRRKPENPEESLQFEREGKLIEFGNDSQEVFGKLVPKLKAGGLMILSVDLTFKDWEGSSESQREFRAFFERQNCTVDVIKIERSGNVPDTYSGDCYLLVTKNEKN